MGPLFSEHMLPGVTRELGLGEVELREVRKECLRCLVAEKGKFASFYVTVGRKE